MSEPTVFLPFDCLDENHEDRLTAAFLSLLRISPVAHLAFLDLVREVQAQAACHASPAVCPSELLSQPARIRTQEVRLEIESGDLVSVALTSIPWTCDEVVTPTPEQRRYDGILYYGDNWVIILENKPQITPSDSELRREIKPNLPPGVELRINPQVVNLVWRDILLRFQLLTGTGVMHGPEKTILQDFRKYVHQTYPHLNPYATFRACDGSLEAIRQRCAEILEALAEGKVKREGLRDYYIDMQSSQGPVGRILLKPVSTTSEALERVERICLRLYPAVMVQQAKWFYGDKGPNPTTFLALNGAGWKVVPALGLRFQGGTKWERELSIDPEQYFAFWQAQIRSGGFRGNVPLNEVFGPVWDALVAVGIVTNGDSNNAQSRFRPGQTVNFCPGWSLEYSWTLNKAEELDDQPGTGGRFVQEARKRIEGAYAAMGRDWQQDLQR